MCDYAHKTEAIIDRLFALQCVSLKFILHVIGSCLESQLNIARSHCDQNWIVTIGRSEFRFASPLDEIIYRRRRGTCQIRP